MALSTIPYLSDPDAVDTKSISYLEMEQKWDLIHDLRGGTLRMQDAGKKWLPPNNGEELDEFTNRLCRAVLFNGYKKTISEHAARPFAKPVRLLNSESLGEFLGTIESDVDGTKKDLTAFAQEVLEAGLDYGLTHCLVDFPRMSRDATLADRRRLGLRAKFIHVTPPQILGHDTIELEDGTTVLDQIRIYEESVRKVGEFGQEKIRRVRVYTRTSWQVWETTDSGASVTDLTADPAGIDPDRGPGEGVNAVTSGGFKLKDFGDHLLGMVPLVTYYTNRAGFLAGVPPFEDLAQLNKAHWQSTASHRNYLDFARIGMLAAYGFTEDEINGALTFSSRRLVRTSRGADEAKLEVVEHTGDAIKAGERDLTKLEEQMEVLGNEPLQQRTAGVSATGEVRDENRGRSRLQTWVRDEETFLRACYEMAAAWEGSTLDDDFGVVIFSDFGIATRGAAEFESLREMRKEGDLSRETLLSEGQRRGFFGEAWTVEDELTRIEKEDEEARRRAAEAAAAIVEAQREAGEADNEDDESADGNGQDQESAPNESGLLDDSSPDAVT